MNLIEIESASTIIHYNLYVVARPSDVNASGMEHYKRVYGNCKEWRLCHFIVKLFSLHFVVHKRGNSFAVYGKELHDILENL